MKDLSHDELGRGGPGRDDPAGDIAPAPLSANPSVPLSTAAWLAVRLTGSSRDALRAAPDAERRAVGLVAFVLVLVFAATGLGWCVALGIARGTYGTEHLPFVVLAGCLVAVIDRAMLRQHWVRRGRLAAAARGFRVPEAGRGAVALVVHWLVRLALSLALSLTTAGFLELGLFAPDISIHLRAETQAANAEVQAEALARHAAAVGRIEAEIARLDTEAAALLELKRAATGAAQTAQMALIAEQDALRARIADLTAQIDCATADRIAEETGTIRCDGSKATAGRDQRFAAADQRVRYLVSERQAAEADLRAVEAALASPPVATAQDVGLARLAAQRAEAMDRLDVLEGDRAARVRADAEADPRHVAMPEGLIVQGEALEEMISVSPWLATRVWLVLASLAILDLAAVIVIALQPVPLTLVVGEVLETETTTQAAIAKATVAVAVAQAEALRARERQAAAEAEVEARLDAHTTRTVTRRHLRAHLIGAFAADPRQDFGGRGTGSTG